ncbi:hypothetical protein D3C72_1824520 [compost metagenome]
MIGDDGQGLERGFRQAARLLTLLGHQEAQVGGGAEAPAVGHAFQFDAPSLITLTQGGDGPARVGALGQAARDLGRRQGRGGGEQQGLDPAFDLGVVGFEAEVRHEYSRSSPRRRGPRFERRGCGQPS